MEFQEKDQAGTREAAQRSPESDDSFPSQVEKRGLGYREDYYNPTRAPGMEFFFLVSVVSNHSLTFCSSCKIQTLCQNLEKNRHRQGDIVKYMGLLSSTGWQSRTQIMKRRTGGLNRKSIRASQRSQVVAART